MLNDFKDVINKYLENLRYWSQKRIFNLFLFNTLIMLMIVLRSAGYFAPYFLLTVNSIVFISLLLSIVLLGLKSKDIFIIGFIFWIFAAFLRIFSIGVWAERTAVYTYQCLIIGVILIIFEYSREKK